MKANVTISPIYWNKSLGGFFFRDQAMRALEELVNRSVLSGEAVLQALNEETEDLDLDDVEEDFYDSSVEELANEFDIPLLEEDEEDEED